MIKLLCLDVDGTLYDSNKKIPKGNQEAVRHAMDCGVAVAIASGRSMFALKDILEQLGIGGTAVCNNGGVVIFDGLTIFRDSMDESLVLQGLEMAEKYGSNFFVSYEDFTISTGKPAPDLREKVQNGTLRSKYAFCKNNSEVKEELKRHKENIIKCSVQNFDIDQFNKMKQELVDLNEFRIAESDICFADLNTKDMGKEVGVRVLAEHLHIPMEEVMCIGDNENDVGMIAEAGIGVAMGNAPEFVKEKADYITETNDRCGVAKAIYKFIG